MEGKIPHTYVQFLLIRLFLLLRWERNKPLSSIFLLLPLRERKTYNVFMERKTNTRYNKCCGGIPKMTKNQVRAYGADLYFPKLSSSAPFPDQSEKLLTFRRLTNTKLQTHSYKQKLNQETQGTAIQGTLAVSANHSLEFWSVYI